MRASVLVCALVCACADTSALPPPARRAAGSPSPRQGGTLRMAFNGDVSRLDPAFANDEFSGLVVHHIHDTLVSYGPALSEDATRLRPGLAESYAPSSDGLTWRFTLREGLRYADGTPLVADDFVHALERVRDPATGSPAAPFYSSIARVSAPDPRHLEIALSHPDALLPMMLAIVASAPIPRGRAADPPASGPFSLESWQPGERIVLARNPRSFRADRTYLDRVEILLSVPRDVAMLKFLTGEIDMMTRLSSSDYLRFASSPAWEPYLRLSTQLVSIGEQMGVRRAPFTDRRVRQAFNYAISKEDTVRLYNGRAVAAHGIIPPPLPGYDATLAPYPHDPERARRLLAEAGYPDGLDLTYTTINEEYTQLIGQSIQADLAAVGVRVRIQVLSFPAYINATGRGELPFGFSAWGADFPDAWSFLFSRFHSANIAEQNATNETGYSNPELDALIDRARVEVDPDARVALYRRAEAILYQDCPMVWNYHPVEVEVVMPYVRDYAPHPVWLRSVREVWLDP